MCSGFPGGSTGKKSACNAGATEDRSPGRGHDNPLQYACLENPMDREARRAAVNRVAKSWTQLKQLSMQLPSNFFALKLKPLFFLCESFLVELPRLTDVIAL